MTSRTTKLILIAALAASVSACGKKQPPASLPGPGDSTTTTDTGGGLDGPGTAADFKRSIQSDTIRFALDQYDIDADSRAILDSQADWLTKYPNARVTIEGHCDERGTREYNLALGDRRANAAKNYLVARGIDPGRISTISYGKERPVALGSDEGSWAQNRRAVTIVLSAQ